MGKVTLTSSGRAYEGWTSVRVERGIDSLAGGFEVRLNDAWASGSGTWPIVEGDECTLALDGETVITGRVDARGMSYGPQQHEASVIGRDRAADLVDCSAAIKTYRGITYLEMLRRACQPFGVSVHAAAPVIPDVSRVLPLPVVVSPGDTVAGLIEQTARSIGALATSDGQGDVVLVRGALGSSGATLLEGRDILRASATFSVQDRYHSYRVLASTPGTDLFSGQTSCGVRGDATDDGVRTERSLIVRGEATMTWAEARRRAEWEASVRAARGVDVTLAVRGWGPPEGGLWQPNDTVVVKSPRIRLDDEMLIVRVTHTLSVRDGARTELRLTRPDGYTPSPAVRRGVGRWTELG